MPLVVMSLVTVVVVLVVMAVHDLLSGRRCPWMIMNAFRRGRHLE